MWREGTGDHSGHGIGFTVRHSMPYQSLSLLPYPSYSWTTKSMTRCENKEEYEKTKPPPGIPEKKKLAINCCGENIAQYESPRERQRRKETECETRRDRSSYYIDFLEQQIGIGATTITHEERTQSL